MFAFFADPRNLPPLMPAWQKVRIDEVTLEAPPPPPAGTPLLPGPAAGSGTTLLITARAAPGFPIRLPWLARIEDFTWNRQFCDVQLKGPFRYWRHCHSVRDETRAGRDGTVVRDEVAYVLPLWPLSAPGTRAGSLAMQALFAYRQRQAARLLPKYIATNPALASGRPER